jgi:polyhydroxyalkanoate synthesis regulator phasin
VVAGVQDSRAGKAAERPDLEHGRLPDVQEKNTARLMNKIEALEQRLEELEQELKRYRQA